MQPSHKVLVQTRMVSDASQLVDGRHGGQDSALRRPSVAVDSDKHHELVCGSQGFDVVVNGLLRRMDARCRPMT